MPKITSVILKHMEHQEDLLYYGKDGAQMLFDTLEDVFSYLKSDIPQHGTKLTQKWDGSPAVLAASDFHGEKFVSLKHSWDKGKRFHSTQEIDEVYSDPSQKELADKLKYLLKYVGMIDIPKDEIWMGDYLFSNSDLKEETIDGEDLITFRPNAIIYAVPVGDPEARKIKNADIGIVWHTTYTGPDYENLQKKFNADVNKLNQVPAVYQIDVGVSFNSVLFSEEDSISINYKLNELKNVLQRLINDPNYTTILENKKLVARMQKYKNDVIRNYQVEIGNYFSPASIKKLMYDEANAHIETLSRDSAKQKSAHDRDALQDFLTSASKTIETFYEAQQLCIELKNIFIERMESTIGMRMFYQSLTRGYIPCKGEGFVVSDIDGNVAKLVTRIKFSLYNWQEDIVKGWTSEKRESSIMASKGNK